MNGAARTESPAALTIDTWQKVAGIGGVIVSGVLALNTLLVTPLAARVERAEAGIHQAERDRADLLQRLGRLDVQLQANTAILRRIEGRLDRRR